MKTMMIKYETICPFCGKVHFMEVPIDRLSLWLGGMSVQEAFPDLSPDDRERLISGICPDCWGKMFGDDSDDSLPPLDADEWYDPASDVPLSDDDYNEMGFDPYAGCYTYDC